MANGNGRDLFWRGRFLSTVTDTSNPRESSIGPGGLQLLTLAQSAWGTLFDKLAGQGLRQAFVEEPAHSHCCDQTFACLFEKGHGLFT